MPLPSEDEEATMYQMIMEQMESHGYHQYEISNYAKKALKVNIILFIGTMIIITDLEPVPTVISMGKGDRI